MQQYPQQNNQGQGTASKGSGFFKALFDFSFSEFVTLKFSSFIYMLLVLVSGVAWVGAILFSLVAFADSFLMGLMSLLGAVLIGGITFLFYIIQFRLILEFFVANIRTAQNTGTLVEQADANRDAMNND